MDKIAHHFHICPQCAQNVGFWERYASPLLINLGCGSRSFRQQRARLIPQAEGTVVELGTGTGLNLPFYEEKKVEHLIGIDPGFSLIRQAQVKTKDVPFNTDIYCDTAEKMPFEDASADCVVSTYTLCTIPDIDAALKEVFRILKPGGKFYFSEHGLSDDPKVIKTQNKINPYWKRFAGGCNLNRNITEYVRQAGFDFESHENFALRGIPEFLGYHHYGIAEKPEVAET